MTATVMASGAALGLLMAGTSAASGAARVSTSHIGGFDASTDTTIVCPPAYSSTTMTLTPTNPVVGQSIVVDVQTTGTPCTQGGETAPTGTVTVSDGTQSCPAALSGSDGVATGSCIITEDTGGSYPFTASYAGDSIFASSTTATSYVRVGSAATSTTITYSTNSPVVGQTLTVYVQVDAQYTGTSEPTPTGIVSVGGAGFICSATLSGSDGVATGSCSGTAGGVNNPSWTDQYSGDSNFQRSSEQTTITVSPATTSTALDLSASTITYGDEHVEHLSVSVSPQYPSIMPTGTVTIREAKTTLCTIKLTSGQGVCKLAATALPPGSYRLAATYNGTHSFNPSASTKQPLTVIP